MDSIRLLINRQPVAIFCSVTILLSFAAYLLPLPRAGVPFLMVLIPAIIAMALTAITAGRAGVRALLRQVGQWRVSPQWLIIILLLALLVRLAMSVIALWLGLIPALQLRPASPAQLLLLASILLIAALPEELGWRGYVLPRLLQRHSALFASLVIGLAWGVLHLALLLPGMMNAGAPVLPTLIQIVGFSVLVTWLYVNSGGKLVLTTLFHAAQSFFVIVNEGIPLAQQVWLMAGVYGATALLVVLLTGPMLVRKRGMKSLLHPTINPQNQPLDG